MSDPAPRRTFFSLERLRTWSTEFPLLIALGLTVLVLSPLWFGVEPSGGDPDRMYRPIKAELSRALSAGRLPLWSDRFGLGVPLAAESHVAAFYPLNLVCYRILDVAAAYRFLMWCHYCLLTCLTYCYARCIGIHRWGGAMSAIAFTFCGFQSIHASHEPFYHILPYMLLVLIATDRYVAGGKWVWMAGVALGWGLQLTLGHFEIQMWTAGLALWTGGWRATTDRLGFRRFLGVVVGLAWGAAIAAVPLTLSWSFLRGAGLTRRNFVDLMHYSFPSENWVEGVVPGLFRGFKGGPEFALYWINHRTTGYEACLYIGTIPLILACVGLTSRRRRRLGVLGGWIAVIPISFALASMPRWWPSGYRFLLAWPGFGYFRCPGRYTLITTLGLSLLAGSGFDRSIGRRRFRAGIGLAVLVAIAGFDRSVVLALREHFGANYNVGGLGLRIGSATLAWLLGLLVLWSWRKRKIHPAVPLIIATCELALLYYTSTTVWGKHIAIPESSPVLRRLMQERDVGRVAGFLENLPIRADITSARPYLVQNLPLPYPWLAAAHFRANTNDSMAARWLRRYGVSHGVWSEPIKSSGAVKLYEGPDPTLDFLITLPPGGEAKRTWTLVRYPDPFPPVRVALELRTAADSDRIFSELAIADSRDLAWIEPSQTASLDVRGPAATRARVVSWNGHTAYVEHNGSAFLIITRTFDPGWAARVNNGSRVRVLRVDGGIQAVQLLGAGRSRIDLDYQPEGLKAAVATSIIAVLACLGVFAGSTIRSRHTA